MLRKHIVYRALSHSQRFIPRL